MNFNATCNTRSKTLRDFALFTLKPHPDARVSSSSRLWDDFQTESLRLNVADQHVPKQSSARPGSTNGTELRWLYPTCPYILLLPRDQVSFVANGMLYFMSVISLASQPFRFPASAALHPSYTLVFCSPMHVLLTWQHNEDARSAYEK